MRSPSLVWNAGSSATLKREVELQQELSHWPTCQEVLGMPECHIFANPTLQPSGQPARPPGNRSSAKPSLANIRIAKIISEWHIHD